MGKSFAVLSYPKSNNLGDLIQSVAAKHQLNEKEIFVPASIVLEGEYGEENVAFGVPVKINQNGVSKIENISLDEIESDLLKKSAEKIRKDINSV